MATEIITLNPDGGIGSEFFNFPDKACLAAAAKAAEELGQLGIITTVGAVVMKDAACEGAEQALLQVEG